MTAAPIDRAVPDRAATATAALVPTATTATATARTGSSDAIMSDPVTTADIAEFTARLARLRSPALGGDAAERAELLSDKAELLGRIAEQYARSDPAYSGQIRQLVTDARTLADVNPALTPSPTTPSPTTP